MMDDWPSVYGKKGLLRPLVRGQALCQLKRLMRGADVHLAISEPMCHAYEKRYGFSFQPFYSGVHVADYLKKAPIGPKPKKPFEIVYVGSILPNAQLTSLIQVARVVNEMAQKGSEIRFSIYSSFAETYRDKLAVGPAVRLQGSLSDADFFSTLVNANALLIPVNFDAESRAFVRYSFPAKLPAYMLSGTPILVYGPRDVTYVNQAAEQGWGYLVDEEGLTGVEKAIRELMVSDDLSQKLGRTAQALSAAQHDVVKIRQEFQRCLLNATRRR
jgi:glycosyltransferase involved in cell wall biosynthesis